MTREQLIEKLKTGIYKKYNERLEGTNGIGETFVIYKDGRAVLNLILEDEDGDPYDYTLHRVNNVLFDIIGEITIIDI